MGTMLKTDKIERVPISVPAIIEPEAAPSVDTLPMAPQPIRTVRHHWGRAATSVLKICLLFSEIPIILALVGYAGVLYLLPATPSAARISVAAHTVAAAPGVYCWFRPGHAECVDPAPPATSTLPKLTGVQGGTVALAFAYPPPTSCATAAWPANTFNVNSNTNGNGKPAGTLTNAGARTLMQVHYALNIGLSPGEYRVALTCQWAPLPALRWLQGSGSATYSVLLAVVAAPPATKPPTK